jgi:hypothetical protein
VQDPDPDHLDPESSALSVEERREQLRQEAIARREAVLLRVTNVREIIIAAVAVACLGLTVFIDVAAPISSAAGSSSSSSARGLSASSPPGPGSDTGVTVSGAS